MDPLYTCHICDAKTYPDFTTFEDLKQWCRHSIQKGEGSFVLIVTCPDCSHLTPDQAFDQWNKRMLKGEIRGYQ